MANPIIEQLKIAQQKSILPNTNWQRDKSAGLEYFRYRLCRPLIKGVFYTYRWWNKPSPWFAPSAVNFLKKWLEPEMVGLEFGSGASSKFFASRVNKLVSVEHHEGWYTHVHQWMDENGLENIDYRLITEKEIDEPKNLPAFFKTHQLTKKDYPYKTEFWDYFHVADEFSDGYFDFILVDGRARVACLLNSLPKLKSGGLMILDNSDRPSYQLAYRVLKDWEHFTCTTGLSDTTFWIKP
ncbi:class I SAM-dependent methyltransferase [Echinicola strongylocentroti]|uniref:Class I SAM-dependent methyltransferase n=1 Tax=Echinicola strongylocentroti TaxID=1795355 RepID=A0A2Z4IF74_9BACT|nr:class I SAM-dependent methyltransferase [Echinicola strongylocentroti]AWW29128.1 class I SAM-dependent methyltransferase [Echinicola strongylocentroti]